MLPLQSGSMRLLAGPAIPKQHIREQEIEVMELPERKRKHSPNAIGWSGQGSCKADRVSQVLLKVRG